VGYFDGVRPRLFGHRGAAGILPENTLPSFARAVADGARYLELDVHATADGRVVVIHDSTVDRTTDGSGAVRELSLAEITRLDAGARFQSPEGDRSFGGRGARIPTLEEVLSGFPDIPLNIEVKPPDPEVVDRVVDLLVSHGATARVLLASARDDLMPAIRRRCLPLGIPTNLASGEVADFVGRVADARLGDYRPPGDALQVPPEWHGIELITAATVRAAHAVGLEVHAWTINTAAEMDRLLDLGVDGIMTDLPALGRDVIERRARSALGS
jgi:glycerophosphoryl diester phosphodiesterase